MARSTTLDLTAYKWTELTADDCTLITFQNLTGSELRIQPTTGSEPTSLLGSAIYRPNEGERNIAPTDIVPGTASADRVWAWTEKGGPVFVSHD